MALEELSGSEWPRKGVPVRLLQSFPIASSVLERAEALADPGLATT